MNLYASTNYLENRGPGDVLSDERLLAFNDSYGEIPKVAWISDFGLATRVVLSTSSTRALVNAVRASAGFGRLPDAFARSMSDLVRVTAKAALSVRTPWLLVHRDLRNVKQLRVVRSWIVRAFEIAKNVGSKPA